MDYKKAGVDIEAGYKSVELMKEHVKKTLRPEVLGGLGGFSGAFSLAKIKEMEEPEYDPGYKKGRIHRRIQEQKVPVSDDRVQCGDRTSGNSVRESVH